MTSEVLEFSDSWTLFRLKGVSLEKHSTGSEGRWAGRAEEHAGAEPRGTPTDGPAEQEGVHTGLQAWWGSRSSRCH